MNSEEDFGLVWDKAFEGLVINRMEGNEEIFGRLMADREFREYASSQLLRRVYETIREHSAEG